MRRAYRFVASDPSRVAPTHTITSITHNQSATKNEPDGSRVSALIGHRGLQNWAHDPRTPTTFKAGWRDAQLHPLQRLDEITGESQDSQTQIGVNMNPRSIACGAVSTSLVAGAFVFGAPLPAFAAGNAITFDAATSVSTGGNPIAVAPGDFDKDGINDVAVASAVDDTVQTFTNDGTGALTAGGSQPGGGITNKLYIQQLEAADFNGDGFDDVVSTNYGKNPGRANVFMNNGSGALQPLVTNAVANYSDVVVTADFNSDGFEDIAAGTWYRTVSVLLGNGDGTFAAKADYTPNSGNFNSSTGSIAAGDFSGDGKPDIAITSYPLQAAFLTNNGDGTFTTTQIDPLPKPGSGTRARGSVLRDINGDGKNDFVIAAADNNIMAWVNDGTGTFAAAVVIGNPGSDSDRGLAAADFNGDGIEDFVAGKSAGSTVAVLAGNGDGTLATATTPSTSPLTAAGSVQTADMNGDCKPDIVAGGATSSNAGVLLNTSTWPAATPITNTPDFGPAAGGNTIDITGTDLNLTCEVTFNGVKVPYSIVDNGKIRVTVPPGTGTVPVRVKSGRGTVEHSYRYEGSGPTPTREIVTISAGAVKGKGKKKTVNLAGETRGTKKKVYVYRAATRKGPAKLIAVTKSKNHAWKLAKASLGGRSSAFFCARVGSSFSNTVRVPKVIRSATVTRGDIVRCGKL